MTPLEISAQELHERRNQGEAIQLIDCREPWENELVRLEPSTLIPMNDTPGRVEELRAVEVPIVVYCHHGVRSMHVVQWLRGQGLDNVFSLAGGIDRWSLEVDGDLPRY
jgi:adenylyltransferase/sulfurtransferase